MGGAIARAVAAQGARLLLIFTRMPEQQVFPGTRGPPQPATALKQPKPVGTEAEYLALGASECRSWTVELKDAVVLKNIWAEALHAFGAGADQDGALHALVFAHGPESKDITPTLNTSGEQ